MNNKKDPWRGLILQRKKLTTMSIYCVAYANFGLVSRSESHVRRYDWVFLCGFSGILKANRNWADMYNATSDRTKIKVTKNSATTIARRNNAVNGVCEMELYIPMWCAICSIAPVLAPPAHPESAMPQSGIFCLQACTRTAGNWTSNIFDWRRRSQLAGHYNSVHWRIHVLKS